MNNNLSNNGISILYDDKYMVPGFIIMDTINNEIKKFIKIGVANSNGFPKFIVRSYEKGVKDSSDSKFRAIDIEIPKGNLLFSSLNMLSRELDGEKVYSIDSYYQGKNNIQFISNYESTIIRTNKDVFNVRHATDFIDINLGDNYSCKYYDNIYKFYNELLKLPIEETTSEDIKKLVYLK